MAFTPGSSQPLPSGPFDPTPIDYTGVPAPPDRPRPAGVSPTYVPTSGEQTTPAPSGQPADVDTAAQTLAKPVFWTYEQAQKEGRMEPTFEGKVSKLLALAKQQGVVLWLGSGFRTDQQQKNAIAEATRAHGADAVPKWAAPVGSSNHQKGEAADIFGDQTWLAQHAPQFGLVQPMSWESWHWEPAGLRAQSTPAAYTQGPPGSLNPTADPQLDASPGEIMAHTATLFSSPLVNPAQASPGASFSTAVTGGLTDKTGQVPGGTIPGIPEVSGAETRSGNVAAPVAGTGTSSPALTGGKAQPVQVNAQPASTSQAAYINEILPFAQAESKRTGIPVEVMIVQSGLETGWGTSGWWRNQRNPAGIGVTGAPGAGFAYKDNAEAFRDYAEHLLGHGEAGQDEFVSLLKAGASPDRLLDVLQRSPWAAGHYGGGGLVQTYNALKAAGVFTPAPAPAPPPTTAPPPPVSPPPASRPSGRGSKRHV